MWRKKHSAFFKAAAGLIAAAFIFASCAGESGGSGNGGGGSETSKSVTSVTLNKTEADLIFGLTGYDSTTLTATVTGTNLEDTDKGVTWTSSKENVATVTQAGVVTAVAVGDAVITATSKYDTSKTATCSVVVTGSTVSGTTVWDFSTQPSNIGDANASYSDESIAATSGSSATLTVTTSGTSLKWASGGYLQSGKNGVTYTSYTSKSKVTYTLTTTTSSTITIVMAGSGDSDETYRWIVVTDSSENIAGKIESSLNTEQQTLTITDAAAGVYTIYTNGVSIYSITVTGESSGGTVVPPAGITLSDRTLSFDLSDTEADVTAALTYTLTPDNVTSGYDKVTWTSSDSTVAAVSSTGVVTAKKAGTAVITVTTDTGSFTDTCTVTVTGDAGKTISLTDTPEGYASVGASFTTSGTTTVTTRAQLLSAVSSGNKVIIIDGMIDMSEGMLAEAGSGVTSMTLGTSALDTFVNSTLSGYANYSAWVTAYSAACSETTEDGESSSDNSSLYDDLWALNDAYGNKIKITLKSNTTIIGKDENAGIRGGSFQLSSVKNVQIRNLKLQDAVDPFPHHEQNSDGGSDGYNAQWDCITIQGSCSNIWIDHCTLEDTFKLGYTTKGTQEKWQVYDGLCDMKGASTKITISNCILKNHDKTMLIGSSDSDGSNSVRFITLYGNYFWNCGQRLPMVRNTTIHILNNYYDSDSSKFYTNSYAVGCRKNCIVYAENNYFGSGIKNSFKDSYGSLYSSGNTDKSSSGCGSTVTGSTLFSSAIGAYSYTAMSASEAKTNAEENAGAGYTLKQ
jgi:pectate lyase